MDLIERIQQRRRHQPRPRSWLAAKLDRVEHCRECDLPWPCPTYVEARNSVLGYAQRQLDITQELPGHSPQGRSSRASTG